MGTLAHAALTLLNVSYLCSIACYASKRGWLTLNASTCFVLVGSCHFGEANQGICWDLVAGTTTSGTCNSRFCRAGWTCGCHNRTHICPIEGRTKYVPSLIAQNGQTATCHQEASKGTARPVLTLGNHTLSLSKKGMLANACQNLVWWHNGNYMKSWDTNPVIVGTNIEQELQERGTQTRMEYRPGDLIAFRFRATSYYCFNSYALLNVNATTLNTESTGVSMSFARKHSADWFKLDFPIIYNSNETAAEQTDFIPLRKKFLASGAAIIPGEDYWREPDGTEDHKISNFYFRIQL